MIAEPPVTAGAVKLSDSWVMPGVTVKPVGASGVVLGMPAVAEEAVPLPTLFTARILTL